MSTSAEDKLSRAQALRPACEPEPFDAALFRGSRADEDATAQALGVMVNKNRFGEHLFVRRWYPAPELCTVSVSALQLLLLQPKSGRLRARNGRNRSGFKHLLDPSQWLFLDIETTGLGSGAGTYAFLVGVAWWDPGGLQIEQFFMRDHTEEHSLLLELSYRLAERRVLVTFNGKSFDWPLLKARYVMTRALTPPAPAAHLDMVHPARQIWRLRLGSVRLTELERQVLGTDTWRAGWSRRNDIDSSLIPQIYSDYLHDGEAEPLAAVFLHNQMDLRGLAALAAKVLTLLAEPESLQAHQAGACELYGISRLLGRMGEVARARVLCERALKASLPVEAERLARRELALLAKREGDFKRANALWQDLLEDPVACAEAYEQLAVYHEHRARTPERAIELSREALAKLPRGYRAGRMESAQVRKWRARIEHRLARLTRKVSLLTGKGLRPMKRRRI